MGIDASVKRKEEPAPLDASVKREPENCECTRKRSRAQQSTQDTQEESPDFTAEMSGLSEVCLACLPEDAPPDSQAYLHCKWHENGKFAFFDTNINENKVRMQVAVSKIGSNRYAAF